MAKTRVHFKLEGVNSDLQSDLVLTEIYGDGDEYYTSHKTSFEQSLNPGIYRARVRSGAQSEDTLIVVEVGVDQKVSLEIPSRFSSAPLPGVGGTHEYYSDPFTNRNITRNPLSPDMVFGAPYLFIYIRMRDEEHAEAYRKRNQLQPKLFAGLKLLDNQGNVLTRFESFEIDESPDVGVARFRAQINPGYYRLVYTSAENRKEWLPIHVLPSSTFDWDTDISLIWNNRPLFPSISLFTPISRHDVQLDLNQYVMEVSATDAVTQTLASGRRVDSLKSNTVTKLLNDKFSNPMTGIMGLHLYLLSGRAKSDSVSTILSNLNQLAPSSPDVEALHFIAAELGLTERKASWQFEDIPMLRLGALAMQRAYLSDNMADIPPPNHAEQLFLHLETSSPWAQTGFLPQPPLEVEESKVFAIDPLNLDTRFIAKISRHALTHSQGEETLDYILSEHLQYKNLEKLTPVLASEQQWDEGVPLWLLETIVKRAGDIEAASEQGTLKEYLLRMAKEYEVMLPTLYKVIHLLPQNNLSVGE